MNYIKCRLGDVAEIIMSSIDKKSKPHEKTVRLCNFTDVYHNWAITKDKYDTFMIATASDNAIEKLTLKKGYVAFTKDSETRDDIGIPTYIADDFNDVVLGYHCALVKPDEHKLSGEYLNAFINSDYIKKYFELNATGSGMRFTLAIQTLEDMPLLLPDLSEQKRIAKVLTDIDSKIAVNIKINKELEVMAKELYDYWFVQFDFPGVDGKPYKSSGGKMVYNEVLKREIPEGWEVKKLGELFNTNRGVSYSTPTLSDSGIPMINLASFSPDNSYNEKGIKYYIGEYSEDKVLRPYDLVMCNTQQTAINYATDIIGRSMLIPDIFETTVIVSSHHVNTIKLENETYKFWMNQLFNSDYFHRYIAYYASGTNIMGLSFNGVTDFEISIPDEKILREFNKVIFDIEKKKSLIMRENNRLQQMRDELLPLLMNGQVSIK